MKMEIGASTAMEEDVMLTPSSKGEEGETRPNPPKDFLAFQCGRRWLAVPFTRARRVVRLENYSPLPGAVPLLPGASNVEGYVVPVLDVAALLNEPPQTPRSGMYLVVVSDGEAEAGLLTPTPPKLHQVASMHTQGEQQPFIEGTYGWPEEKPEYIVEIVSIEQLMAAARKAYE